jgi:threonylcarbamoyladenosine tRNA methylthiotransferase MtaB
MPDACIGVDVIVGFPAEDEARFEHTYRFLNDLPISYLHVFTYSERPGTVAVDDLDRIDGERVPRAERSRRNKMLRVLSQKRQHAFYRAHQDTVRPVLWEGGDHGGVMYGYTDNYIRVQRPSDPALDGKIEEVRLGPFAANGTLLAEDPAFVPLV